MKKWVPFLIIALIIALPIAWFLASPLFLDKTVNEQLPKSNLGTSGNAEEETAKGSFADADNFHKTSGIAKITVIDGKRYLSFEDFKTTNGPDLYVYLSKDNGAGDFVNLGRLKGNIGNQNYEIPEGTDIDSYSKVLIWCRTFSVLFGSADLHTV